MRCGILHAVMKSIDMVATALVTVPAPEAKAKPARKDTMIRTIKVGFGQSGEMSVLISRLIVQQRWAYNMAVREKLDDPRVTRFGLDGMLTKWRHGKEWMEGCVFVQRAGLRQGLDAVQKFMDSNAKKRSDKIMWKNMARRDRESEGIPDIDTAANLPPNKWSHRRNRWSHRGNLFRRKCERQALCVFGKPVPKGNNIIMLPGIGTVKVHGDVEGLDMRSFQLVEMTKRITRRTEDCNRTYRLHIQTRTKAPKPSESAVVRGVDMGIVHNATTVDLDTGHPTFYDIPKDCKRTKNDGISKMHADLSRKRGGSGNRRIRQNGKGDSRGDASKQDKTGGQGRINRKAGRNRPRRPKSRSYRELQRRIRKKREKITNRQTNWERHASKRMADGAGTVSMENLNLRNMTAKAKGWGRSAKTGLNREMAYSRPRTFLSQIEQTCKNMGVAVITVDPKGTSITCHRCSHKDKNSSISQAEFQCTNHDCGYAGNADVNAAHNIAVKATAGRQGLSSQDARFQRGIAPARSANQTREPSVGGIDRAPEKDRSTVYFCI